MKLVARAVSGVQPVVFKGLHEVPLDVADVLSVSVVLSALANVDNNEEALSTDIRSSSFIVLRCINFGISHYFIDISQGDKGKFDKY